MKLTIKKIQKYETSMLKEIHQICQRNDIDYFMAYGSALGAIRDDGPIPWDTDTDIAVPYNQLDHFIRSLRQELSDKFYLDYHDNNEFYPLLFPRIGLKGFSTVILHVDVYILTGGPTDAKKQLHYKKKAHYLNRAFMAKNTYKKYYGDLITNKRKLLFPIIKLLLFFVPNKFIINLFQNHCSKYPYKNAKFVVNANGGYGKKEIHRKSLYGKGTLVSYAGIKVKVPEKYDAYLRHFYGDYTQKPSKDEREIQAHYKIAEK